MLEDIIVYAILIGLTVLFLVMAVNGSFSSRGSGASLTAFHDFQPQDRQRAVEMIIQEKAGKQKDSQESGESGNAAPMIGERKEAQ